MNAPSVAATVRQAERTSSVSAALYPDRCRGLSGMRFPQEFVASKLLRCFLGALR